MQKRTFVFSCDWWDVLRDYAPDVRLSVFEAIVAYVSDGVVADLSGVAQVAFAFIRRELDWNDKKYEATVSARSEAGRGKGAPLGNTNASKRFKCNENGDESKQIKTNKTNTETNKTNAKTNKTNAETNKTNTLIYDNDNVNDNDIKKEDTNPSDGVSVVKARFIPPTVSEVADYIHSKGFAVDAEQFHSFYESKGWMVGKNKMRDWRAAVRTWVRPDRARGQPAVSMGGDTTVHFASESDTNAYAADRERSLIEARRREAFMSSLPLIGA